MLRAIPRSTASALVIFDEFHERSLDADLGLALTLRARSCSRADLRLLVMSATLDGASRSRELLGDAPLDHERGACISRSRRATRRNGAPARIEAAVAAATCARCRADEGDVLVFLPGAAEIRRVAGAARRRRCRADVRVAPLYGDLRADEQDRAIAPGAPGARKVVLATSIAETSLTIEGVRVVVDSGLSRVPRFSPRTGMTRLETVRVSRASADQRRGRAGRTAPGVCYRLWPEQEHHAARAHAAPEIVDADLAPLALDLAAAGIADPAELRWLDPPPAAAFAQARELLRELDALDAAGRITEHGRAHGRLGTHPRLAHMLARRAKDSGLGAARLRPRGVTRRARRAAWRGGPSRRMSICGSALELMRDATRGNAPALVHGATVDRDALRRVRDRGRERRRALGVATRSRRSTSMSCGLLLASPIPIASRSAAGAGARYVLRNGRGADLPGERRVSRRRRTSSPRSSTGDVPRARVYLAAPLARRRLRGAVRRPDRARGRRRVGAARRGRRGATARAARGASSCATTATRARPRARSSRAARTASSRRHRRDCRGPDAARRAPRAVRLRSHRARRRALARLSATRAR